MAAGTPLDRLTEARSGPPVRFALDLHGAACELGRDEMLTRSLGVARRLRELGVGPGDRVLCLLPTSREFLVALLGIWSASGAIVPAMEPPRTGQERYRARLRDIIEVASPQVVIGTDEALAEVRLLPGGAAPAALSRDDLERAGASGGDVDGRPAGDDLALLMFTSGSTGLNRAASIRHRNIVSNIDDIGRRIDVRADDRFVSWLPLYHDMGFIGGLLCPLLWEIPSYLMSTEHFLRSPALWLRALSGFRASLSPAATFAYDLVAGHVKDHRLEGVDLSAWRFAWVGAEQVFPRALEAFRTRFESRGLPETTLQPAYGLAEATLAVSHGDGRTPFRAEWIDRDALRLEGAAEPAEPNRKGSVPIAGNGSPLEGTEVRIADDAGAALGERVEGRVLVRGPAVTDGYYGEPAGSLLTDGWLDSGDLGFLSGGEVFITGRTKDILIRGGLKLRPSEIESAVSGLPGVRAGRVAAIALPRHDRGEEEIVVLVEIAGQADPGLVGAVRRSITERAGIQVDRVVVVPRGSIPRTSSGKIQRGSCLDLVPEVDG